MRGIAEHSAARFWFVRAQNSCGAVWCSVVQFSVVSCGVLQCVAFRHQAVVCSRLEFLWSSVVQCGAVWCSVVQCGAVCYSVLQCCVVYCSVLQYKASCCRKSAIGSRIVRA